MAITFDPTTPIPVLTVVLIAEDGFANDGAATIVVKAPSGNSSLITGTADGAGDFTGRFVPQEQGTHTVVTYNGPTASAVDDGFPSAYATVTTTGSFTATGG